MSDFALLDPQTLISRKIRVIENHEISTLHIVQCTMWKNEKFTATKTISVESIYSKDL